MNNHHDNQPIVKVVCLMAAAFLAFVTVIAAAVLIGTLI